MRLKLVGTFAFAAVLAIAPQAFALGSGSHKGPNGTVINYSGTSSSGQVSGTFSGGSLSGTYEGNSQGGVFNGTYTLSAAEPFTAFALGLGLLGARYLRRRK